MGIRFYCPNGHKLNVKTFQAGRRGICPYCGASMMIPSESTIPGGKPGSAPAQEPASPVAMPSTVNQPSSQTTPTAAQPTTAGTPTAASWSAAPTPLEPRELATQPTPVMATSPAASPLPAPAPGSMGAASSDPLTEVPTAVWYVRPAAGGQYGPATGDIMRGWLNEGRIGADSLVWREGWRDWQEASQVFPQLKPNEMTSLLSGSVTPASLPSVPSSPAVRRSMPPTRLIIGVLAVTVVILLVVLLMILFSQPAATPEPKPAPTASAATVAPPSPWNPLWT